MGHFEAYGHLCKAHPGPDYRLVKVHGPSWPIASTAPFWGFWKSSDKGILTRFHDFGTPAATGKGDLYKYLSLSFGVRIPVRIL